MISAEALLLLLKPDHYASSCKTVGQGFCCILSICNAAAEALYMLGMGMGM